MIFPLLHFPFFSCVSKCDEYQWIPWKFNKFSNSGRSIRIRDDKLQLRCVQFHPNEDWIMVTSTAIVSIWDNWRKNRGKKDWKWHLFDLLAVTLYTSSGKDFHKIPYAIWLIILLIHRIRNTREKRRLNLYAGYTHANTKRREIREISSILDPLYKNRVRWRCRKDVAVKIKKKKKEKGSGEKFQKKKKGENKENRKRCRLIFITWRIVHRVGRFYCWQKRSASIWTWKRSPLWKGNTWNPNLWR